MGRTSRTILAVLLMAGIAEVQGIYEIDTIRTIEVSLTQNWRTEMANNFASKTYIKATIKVDGKVYPDVGVRHKGFSTYKFLPSSKTDKRPWKIAVDEYVPGQRIQGYRTLNIGNNIWDPSFVREVAGYEFMRKFIPAPKCCYVKLKVNGQDLGLFTHAQQINKDFLQEWFRDDEGNRYRGERALSSTSYNDTALTWLGTTQSRYEAAYELKTENGPYTPWTRLIHAIDVLNNTPTAQLPTELPKVLDVDGALRFLAVANIQAWLDSYISRVCKNFYLYEDVFHGQIAIQPWDLNNSFGGIPFELGVNGIARLDVYYNEKSSANPRPLFGKLVQRPEWRARYLAHYRQMLKAFDWAKMSKRIDQLRALIRPELEKDSLRIYTMQQFDQNMTQSINCGFVTVPGIQPFFVDRNAYLLAHADLKKTAPTLSGLVHSPAAPSPKDTVWVNVTVSGATATTVSLYHRIQGPYIETPMFDDGKHNDGGPGDGVYGASIPPGIPLALVEYYTGASGNLTQGGAMAFEPPLAEYTPKEYRVGSQPIPGAIMISEFVAKNDNGIRDENNDREDWIEVTNTGNQALPVSGMYLTDNVANPTKWKIPAGHTLQPGKTLLVWADDEAAQGPLHASFKLSAGGEEVALFDTDGKTNLDWISFGQQQSDVSTGRPFGFSGVTVTYTSPTPRQANRPEPCGHLDYTGLDSTSARFALAGQGTPSLGSGIAYVVTQAPASTVGGLALATIPFEADIAGFGALLVHPAAFLYFPIMTDASGSASFPITIPNATVLSGATFYFQAFVHDGTNGGFSSGVATRICP